LYWIDEKRSSGELSLAKGLLKERKHQTGFSVHPAVALGIDVSLCVVD
jgi:hypothetical protein